MNDVTGKIEKAAPIEGLWEDPANARTHDDRNRAAIRSSLMQFGQVDPLVVLRDPEDEKRTGRVIAGNGRLSVMRELGWESARVLWVDMTDSQATAFAIAHNRTGELASWDNDVLGALIKQIEEAEPELFAVTGFSLKELEAISGEFAIDPDQGGMPELRSSDDREFQEMTFLLHDAQVEIVSEAVRLARASESLDDSLNPNRNGNAIVHICEEWARGKS